MMFKVCFGYSICVVGDIVIRVIESVDCVGKYGFWVIVGEGWRLKLIGLFLFKCRI